MSRAVIQPRNNIEVIVNRSVSPGVQQINAGTGIVLTGTSSNVTISATGNVNFANNANFANVANTANVALSVAGANVTGTVANAQYALVSGSTVIADTANVALSVAGANVSGAVALATLATTATTANVALSVAGANVTGSVANATQANVANVANSVAGANVTGSVANATVANTANVANSVAGANVSGAVALATLAGTANSALSVAGANVSGQVANALVAGTVYTNAQPNITSLGTLSSLVVSGNTTIGGNLLVNGNTTYINIETLQVQDPVIQLGGGPNGAPLTANDGKDRGTLLHYYNTQPVDAFMGWDNSGSEFVFGSNVSISSDIVTVNTFGNIKANTFKGNAQLGVISALSNNEVMISNDLVPTSNNVFSLGSPTSFFKDVYIGPGSLYIDGKKVLESEGNIILFSATENQTMQISTLGSGDVDLRPLGSGSVVIRSALKLSNAIVSTSDGTPVRFANPGIRNNLFLPDSGNVITFNANTETRFNSNVVVNGDLTINGNSAVLNVPTLRIFDNLVDISANTTGTPTLNAGIRVIRGDEAAVQVRWNETSKTWQFTNTGAEYFNMIGPNSVSNVLSLGSVSNLKITGGSSGQFLSTDGAGNLSWSGSIESANTANIANVANIAYSVSVANVSGIGNIATVNLDGNVSNVLAGNGTWIAQGAASSNWQISAKSFNVSSTQQQMFTLPANAIIDSVTVYVDVAFDEASTVAISGYLATTDVDLTTAGRYDIPVSVLPSGTSTVINLDFNNTEGSTVGSGRVVVTYSPAISW